MLKTYKMKKNDIISILALNSVKGIGAAAISKLKQSGLFKNQDPYEAINDGLEILKKQQNDSTINSLIEDAIEIINKSLSDEIKLIPITDTNYPKKITQIKNPPPVLFYKGNLDRMDKVVGIIGTRNPNETGKIIAGRLGKYFSDNGFSIANGLALGIDSEAIQLNGNYRFNTIGIMAGGLNYNQARTILKTTALEAEKVLENGGLLLSEYPSGIKEDTFTVVKSCRIQAAVSDGLILIQSKLNGGSKFTIESFAELPRPFAVIKPIEREKDLQEYEANMEIIENKEFGIAKMTGIKSDKIRISKIEVIAEKIEYDGFASLIENSIKKSSAEVAGDLFSKFE